MLSWFMDDDRGQDPPQQPKTAPGQRQTAQCRAAQAGRDESRPGNRPPRPRAAQLRSYLRETFGNTWFTRRDAGSLVRELWSEGQKPTADEILQDVTGTPIELEAAGERVNEALAAA